MPAARHLASALVPRCNDNSPVMPSADNYRYTVVLRPASGKWPLPTTRAAQARSPEEDRLIRASRAREKLQRAKQSGYCIGCFQKPATPGITRCAECSNRQKEYRKRRTEKKDASNLVRDAAEINTDRTIEAQDGPADLKHSKPDPANQKTQNQTVRRREAKAQGICTNCLKQPAVTGKTKCASCGAKHRNYLAKCRAKGKDNSS